MVYEEAAVGRTDLTVADRLVRRFDELRDRVASAVAGDEVRGELADLRHAVADLDTRTARRATSVNRRLDVLADMVAAATEELGDRIERQGRSWFRRLVWLVLGAAAGAAAAAMFDPVSGRRRRRRLRDQAQARARDLAEGAAARVRSAADDAGSAAVGVTRRILPGERPDGRPKDAAPARS